MKNLTVRQQELYDYIKNSIRENGYPPSIREICTSLNMKSTSTAHMHLENLEKKGYIKRGQYKNRSIEILDPSFYNNDQYINVPIVGTVTAGVPILAIENIEDSFPIPINLIGSEEVFMLKIKGDSMIDAGIFDKDLVLVSQEKNPANGEIVVALIEDSATVKTYFKEDGHFRLQPENKNYEPIIVDKLEVLGKVIGLYRTY